MKLQEDLAPMRAWPLTRLEDCRVLRVVVSRCSTIRVGRNLYSVMSRVIGAMLDVRVYPDRLEVPYAGEPVATLDRIRGTGQAALDDRHLIGSLVRKPGAFARDRDQAGLFPTTVFRQAYDALITRHGSRADVDDVRILHLAAHTSEHAVETVLADLLAHGTLRDSAHVKALVQPEVIAVPVCILPPPDLTLYDACLQSVGGAA